MALGFFLCFSFDLLLPVSSPLCLPRRLTPSPCARTRVRGAGRVSTAMPARQVLAPPINRPFPEPFEHTTGLPALHSPPHPLARASKALCAHHQLLAEAPSAATTSLLDADLLRMSGWSRVDRLGLLITPVGGRPERWPESPAIAVGAGTALCRAGSGEVEDEEPARRAPCRPGPPVSRTRGYPGR